MAWRWTMIFLGVSMVVVAQSWQIKQYPADLDRGRDWMTVVAGHGNPIAFALQTTEENCRQDQDLMIEFHLPIGFDVLDSSKDVTEHYYTRKFSGQQLIVTDSFRHTRHRLTPLKARLSEWRTYKILLRVPEQVPENAQMVMRLHHQGKMELERKWQVRATKLENTADHQLRKLTFGLYDYGFSSLRNSADEILNLFLDVGVNQFVVLNTARTPEGFSWLGSVHHDYFFSREHPDVLADGTTSRGGFCDPEAVIAAGAEAVIPKAIARMVEAADSSASQEVFIDYEPSGMTGFSELSVKKFMTTANVSEADFTRFRKVVVEQKHGTWRSNDPVVKAIYPKWAAFSTSQSAEYIGAIARAFKAHRPEGRFWITQRSCTGADDPKTIAIGNDNAAMVASLDGALPQIYYGYGAAAAKRTATVVEDWRREINRLNPSCRLVPLLLNRYAGASVKNIPEMVRLQGLASVASGADGVSYYFVQHFDGDYYPHLLRMRQELARYEDFYVDGQRVDHLFELVGMGDSKATMSSWPAVQVEVQNPGWHMTAHQLGTKILLTLFNFDKDNELLFQVKTKANYSAAENCTWKQGEVLLGTAEAAFIVFEQ